MFNSKKGFISFGLMKNEMTGLPSPGTDARRSTKQKFKREAKVLLVTMACFGVCVRCWCVGVASSGSPCLTLAGDGLSTNRNRAGYLEVMDQQMHRFIILITRFYKNLKVTLCMVTSRSLSSCTFCQLARDVGMHSSICSNGLEYELNCEDFSQQVI